MNTALNDLKVIFNPFSEEKGVLQKIIGLFPNLIYLDNKKLEFDIIFLNINIKKFTYKFSTFIVSFWAPFCQTYFK